MSCENWACTNTASSLPLLYGGTVLQCVSREPRAKYQSTRRQAMPVEQCQLNNACWAMPCRQCGISKAVLQNSEWIRVELHGWVMADVILSPVQTEGLAQGNRKRSTPSFLWPRALLSSLDPCVLLLPYVPCVIPSFPEILHSFCNGGTYE